jgi:hypothetical protein
MTTIKFREHVYGDFWFEMIEHPTGKVEPLDVVGGKDSLDDATLRQIAERDYEIKLGRRNRKQIIAALYRAVCAECGY